MLAKEIKSLDKGVGGLDYSGEVIKLAKPKPWKEFVFYTILTKDKNKDTLKITFVNAKDKKAPIIESDFGKHIKVNNGIIKEKKTDDGKETFLLIDLTKGGKLNIEEPSKIQKIESPQELGKPGIVTKAPGETDKKPMPEEKLLENKIKYWHGVWKNGGYQAEGINFEVFKDIAITSFIQESNYERDLRRADYYHSQRLQQIKFQEDYKKKLGAYPYNKQSSYKKNYSKSNTTGKLICSGCEKKITKKESSFSLKKYKKELCFDCQKEQ